jgi:hypothetical protein
MLPVASFSILQKDVITEDDLKLLTKLELQMDKRPHNLSALYFFFSIYKLFSMKNNDYFINGFLADKSYFRTVEVVGDDGTVLTEDKLSFVSTTALQKRLGLNPRDYNKYFNRFTKMFKSHKTKVVCRLFEWTEEAHDFFMPLLEAHIQGKFKVPTTFKRLMNEYDMSVKDMIKAGGYDIKRFVEMQEKMDDCYDETGEGDKLGVYHKRPSFKKTKKMK